MTFDPDRPFQPEGGFDPQQAFETEGSQEGVMGALKAIDSFVRSVASGATFGFADEIAAGLDSLVSADPEKNVFVSGSFRENLERERARDRDISTPARIAGEIAGGLGTGVATAPLAVARGAGTLANLGRGAVAGAVEGGLAGAGFSEGGLEERAAGAARGAGAGAVVGAAAPAIITGAVRAGQGVRNLARGGGRFASRAQDQLGQAIARDQQTPQQLAARIGRLGDQATVADVGGENVRGLGRAAAAIPGPAKAKAQRVLQSRQAQQGSRLRATVGETLSSTNFNDTVNDIIVRRKAASKPIYDEVLQAGNIAPPGARGDNLREFIGKAKLVKRAISRAKSLPKFADLPDTDIQVLDQAYKEIGGMAQKARRDGDGVMATNLSEMRVALKNRITNRVPEYEDALNIFTDDSQILDLVREGRRFIMEDAEITAKQIVDMPGSEREAFLIGASRALKDIVDRTPDSANAVRRIFGNRQTRDKIKALFPNVKEFRNFQRLMQQEGRFAETRNAILSGSRTAPLQAEISNLGVIPKAAADVGADLATGGPPGVVSGLIRGAREAVTGPSERTLQSVGDLLFTQGTKQNEDILREIFARRLANRGVGLLGGAAGNTAAIGVGGLLGPQ